MSQRTTQRIHHVTAFISCAAIGLALFFQISKGGPFGDINPFGVDPYDAIGSFAFQGALLIGILTYARALRYQDDPAQSTKLRLILRGNILVLLAILITLIADAIAVILQPLPPSYWGTILLIALALMFILTLTGVVALIVVFKPIQTGAPPHDLTLADGMDDLWTLVRVPVTKASAALPRRFVEWVTRFRCDWLFMRLPWLNPRLHPWRFASILGLLVGVGLVLAQLQEGPPPSLAIGLLLAGIYIVGELSATLLGFAILGGYLGLRPGFSKSN
jgi:hypothetical protein